MKDLGELHATCFDSAFSFAFYLSSTASVQRAGSHRMLHVRKAILQVRSEEEQDNNKDTSHLPHCHCFAIIRD